MATPGAADAAIRVAFAAQPELQQVLVDLATCARKHLVVNLAATTDAIAEAEGAYGGRVPGAGTLTGVAITALVEHMAPAWLRNTHESASGCSLPLRCPSHTPGRRCLGNGRWGRGPGTPTPRQRPDPEHRVHPEQSPCPRRRMTW